MADTDEPIKRVRANWTDVVLVCRKCTKRAHGGFGEKGKTRLAKALRGGLADNASGRKAKIGVVEVGCLGICPKGGVTVVHAAAPGDWAVVPIGTKLSSVLERLGFPATARPS